MAELFVWAIAEAFSDGIVGSDDLMVDESFPPRSGLLETWESTMAELVAKARAEVFCGEIEAAGDPGDETSLSPEETGEEDADNAEPQGTANQESSSSWTLNWEGRA
ncbi:predicted protein [Arabidopsis lyrata subsp. lyrata]|uniref:Predicted protein n=1 Tax=Arabidopsis lyrata subsp. lyrata TaxID=81972 RepID=D7LNV6_ARALL|nr:predicted protein [Arabidopsis lyrata subsp. lyrata]